MQKIKLSWLEQNGFKRNDGKVEFELWQNNQERKTFTNQLESKKQKQPRTEGDRNND